MARNDRLWEKHFVTTQDLVCQAESLTTEFLDLVQFLKSSSEMAPPKHFGIQNQCGYALEVSNPRGRLWHHH